MPKPVKIFLILLFLAICFALPAYAADLPETNPQDSGTNTQTDGGGLFDKMLAAPLNGLAYSIITLENAVGGMETFDQLVFNQGDKKYGDPFTTTEWDLLDKWYKAVATSMSCLVLIAVFVTSLKAASAGINPDMKFNIMEDTLRWFYALVIIAGATLFIWLCIVINNAMVQEFYNLGMNIAGNMKGVTVDKSFFDSIQTGSYLTTAIVRVSYAFLSLYFNILYLIRKIVLIVMYVFTPIMAWMWAINKKVSAVTIWVSEVISTTFMQATHALTFAVWTSFSGPGSVYHYWLPQLIGLSALIPITIILRKSMEGLMPWLMGSHEETWAGGFMGLAALGASMMPHRGFSPLTMLGKGSPGLSTMNLTGTPSGPTGTTGGIGSPAGTTMYTGAGAPGTFATINRGFGGTSATSGMTGGAVGGGIPTSGPAPGIGTQPGGGISGGATTFGSSPGINIPSGGGISGGSTSIPGSNIGGINIPGGGPGTVGTSSGPTLNTDGSFGVSLPGQPQQEIIEGGLTKAAMHGMVGGGIAERIAAATAKVGAFPLGQGAEKVGALVGGMVGSATRGVSTAGSIVAQTVAKHRTEDKSLGESLREVTGVTAEGRKGTAQAVFRAAAMTGAQVVSPGSSVALANRWTPTKRITSIDGVRHR